MKLKKILLLILLSMSLNLFAQVTTTKEGTKIEILKAKLVDNSSVFWNQTT
ncbi:hypothetical protein [Flavobacterium aestuarii]|uniref:hypothetical protein n=1 Tax=Flavobacterium aestuarii TaxID=3149227 RepID=UPI0032B53198